MTRYLLPSYASHIILENTPDKETAAKTTVKIYRLEHRTMPVEQFAKRLPDGSYQSPYHPIMYRPYFLGEFDVRGALPRPSWSDQLCLEQADLGLHEGVVQGVADGADRCVQAGLHQPGSERERGVLGGFELSAYGPGTSHGVGRDVSPEMR